MITAWKWDPSFLPKNGGQMYGWFFFMWIGIMVIEGVLLLPVAAKRNRKTTDRVVLIYGLIMLAAEIYKQIFFTIEKGEYPWNLFPWQFCSVPMFAAVIAPLLKNGRVKDAIYRFLSFFGLIAGIMTLIIPEGFYWDYVTITCHSFFWHTSIVIIGLYLIIANGYAKSIKSFLPEWLGSAVVYAVTVGVALILDTVWGLALRNVIKTELTFNMFYISPFYNSTLPVFRDVQPYIPYPVFLLFYVTAFCAGAAAVWFCAFGIRKIFGKLKRKKRAAG
ncbi:MAG: YwaF family protein [Clostridia bacterium]|nr:YwaF family protein [Clostridia bacterium]